MGCCQSKQKKLLILDMNNVLVYRAYSKTLEEEALLFLSEATLLGEHYTWKRPDLDKFISYALDNYTVAVWSSAWAVNVDRLCAFCFGERRKELLFEWDQTKCIAITAGRRKPLFQKHLIDVWHEFPQYDPSNTIILDDSQEKMAMNPEECVRLVEPWHPWDKETQGDSLINVIKPA
jgi:hypothetical protein